MEGDKKLHYDFSECRDLALNARRNDTEYKDAVEYYHSRVFHTDKGFVYCYKQGELERFKLSEFKESQMIGFPKALRTAIEAQTKPYDEVLETKSYVVDVEKRKINSLKEIYAAGLKDEIKTENSKEYLQLFKTFLKDIVANSRDVYYNYVTNWLAAVVQLKKPPVALILVTSSEGIGKSMIPKLLSTLFGKKNCASPRPDQLAKFNFQCYGKILVTLEETESISASQIKNDGGFMDTVKNLLTNDIYPYEDKGITAKPLPNINSIYMSSNYPLPNCAGRRFCNITPSTKWLQKYDIWEKLYNLSDANIKEIYDYLMSVDVSNWNAERECKKLEEENGNLKEIEKMNNAFVFMKQFYALEKKDEKIKTSELYEQYKNAIAKPYGKSTFYDKISELNVERKTGGKGVEYFYINGEQLFNEFKKRNLISREELHKFNDEEEKEEEKEEQKKDDKSEEIEELKRMIEQLKQEKKELKKENKKLKEIIGESIKEQTKEEDKEEEKEKVVEKQKPTNGSVFKIKASKYKADN